ncbi:alpha/beta fold hydrolase [Haloarchaeobius sp. HME9146]|uniref:alpha/beta fold hydrolase n=1 Tax=Haloarchaeobius sp. HME9146 TaxID=2978732 RepID=UPI0021C209CB|nr:alpha/beta hydrolase [Haloarchaeobius sp. HME9146]MCT9096080.1 alpha/beta hydrolase [Haloarchaeobius sp. HME9146]
MQDTAAPGSSSPSDSARKVTLADGRSLAFAEYGDPDGTPVIAFHGLPGSRLFGRFYADAAMDAGVRIVAPARPGYGESSPKRDRTVSDWAADVRELADHLGFDEFSVVGYSAGGPHALAVAASCDRVTRVAVVAGMAPRAVVSGGPWFLKLMVPLGRHAPWILGALFRMQAWLAERQDDAEMLSFLTDRPIGDVPVDGQRTVEAVLAADFQNAFEHGPSGAVGDSRAVNRPWGVAFDDIDVPVRGWYGTADDNVPVEAAGWLSDVVPEATVERVPDEDHLSVLVETRETVCSWLAD